MKVCVLQPDYSTCDVDYKDYDPPRDLTELLAPHKVDHILLNKLTTYKQLKELKERGYDIFVNLCEGYLDWEVPSIDVIYSLDLLKLPYTGPTVDIYDPTKTLMKYVAYCEGVKTPGYNLITDLSGIDKADKRLTYPLFIKPEKAGDSLGIDEQSVVRKKEELTIKVSQLLSEFGSVLVEEYIPGREFTVLVAANADGKTCTVFKPVEYIFPSDKSIKTYSLKTSELHPDSNIPCDDPILEEALRTSSEKIFKAFNGVGYARLDFRVNEARELFFLEINFTCSVFYKDGYEGSADYILQFDGIGKKGFLNHIIDEGIARYKRKVKCYELKGNAIAGYGIYSTKDFFAGDVLFCGEEASHRIVTKSFVRENWNEEQQLVFRRYAYALSHEVYVLWDVKPEEWAPQNHSCNPNTKYEGLNVIASRNIQKGEELTLDYSSFLDDTMEPFLCQCREDNCKGEIRGTPNNSVSERSNERVTSQ